jgi:GT2 family glycosyltransferase
MEVIPPVLGIPVLNRFDLLDKCIESIDYSVDLLIIDNSEGLPIHRYEMGWPGTDLDPFITQPPDNLGVAASWNLVIKTHPADPYWLIANADVEFGPGDIAAMVEQLEKGGPRWVGLNGDWRLMGLTAEAVDKAGFFDENLHPVYCEDADYERRCTLAGVPWYFINGSTTHVGSVSYRSDERGARNNARTYPANVAYYIAKWGAPPRQGESFTTPFDLGGDLRAWTLDRRRLAANRWS